MLSGKHSLCSTVACVCWCVDPAGSVCGLSGLTPTAEDGSRGGAAADQDHHQHTQEAAQHGGPGCAQQGEEGQGPASCSQVLPVCLGNFTYCSG